MKRAMAAGAVVIIKLPPWLPAHRRKDLVGFWLQEKQGEHCRQHLECRSADGDRPAKSP
jgi:hypothetical protein